MSENGAAMVRTESTAIGLSGSVQITGLAEVFRLAERLAEAQGFVPGHLIGKPNAIAATILTGIELGMGPMESMRSFDVIDGKPAMKPEVMLARAIRAGIRHSWERHDGTIAVLVLERAGAKHRQSFSIEDARRADLLGKANWKRYPDAMLRARCVSAAMRAFCPDVLGAGVYTADEVDGLDAEPARYVETRTEAAEAAPALPSPSAEPPAKRTPRRVDVEIEDGVIVSVSEAIADVSTPDELRAWITARNRKAPFAKLALHRQAKAREVIVERSTRLGCDPEMMLLRAGLLQEPSE